MTGSLQTTFDKAAVKAAAAGRWADLLPDLAGIDPDLLDGKGHPCPWCGGTDRFAALPGFADTGAVICRRCHSEQNGDGFAAVMKATGGDFPAALAAVADRLGIVADDGPRNRRTADRLRQRNPENAPNGGGSVDAAPAAGGGTGPTFDSEGAAAAAVAKPFGRPADRRHVYRDAAGEPVGVVLRWDRVEGGKDVRQLSRRPAADGPDGWAAKAMPEPRPLYRLPEFAAADRRATVFVVEGEPAADALAALGLCVVTSPGGSSAAKRTDWSPLAGRDVTVWPDADEPGAKYAAAVAAALAALDPPATVRELDPASVYEPPFDPDGGADGADAEPPAGWDAADFLEAHDAAEPDALRERVEAAATVPRPARPEPGRSTGPPPFRPFPMAALPAAVRTFVAETAAAVKCPPSYVALPALAAAAGMVGSACRLRLRNSWSEPAILWTGTIGESGTTKSPAFDAALDPVKSLQKRALKRHRAALEAYDRERTEYEAAVQDWKKVKAGDRGEPPEPPNEPIPDRCWLDDSTTEAVGAILEHRWRGVLVASDELSGMLSRFDRYAATGGGDAAKWIEFHRGRPVVIDRKTGGESGRKAGGKTTFLPAAAVSITGTIQPKVLAKCLSENRDNGFAARLLFAMPPRVPRRWTEDDVSEAVAAAYAASLETLLTLEPATDADGDPAPVYVGLTAAAKREWVRFFNEHNAAAEELEGDDAWAWSKLEGYAARLALVVHLLRWAGGEAANPACLDAASMTAGVTLSRWFAGEAARVYAMFGEDDADRRRRELADWIGSRGGRVTAREVQQGRRKVKSSGDAERLLADLIDARWGRWEPRPPGESGGRPTREFVLHPPAERFGPNDPAPTVYETSPKRAENGGFVDVDAPGAAPATTADADDGADDGEVVE